MTPSWNKGFLSTDRSHLVDELHALVDLQDFDDLVGESAGLEHPHGLVVEVDRPRQTVDPFMLFNYLKEGKGSDF